MAKKPIMKKHSSRTRPGPGDPEYDKLAGTPAYKKYVKEHNKRLRQLQYEQSPDFLIVPDEETF